MKLVRLNDALWAKKKAGYVSQLLLWNLIEIANPQDGKGQAKYRITMDGINFINHNLCIPLWIWTHNSGSGTKRVATPEGKEAAPKMNLNQMIGRGSPCNRPEKLVSDSVPALI